MLCITKNSDNYNHKQSCETRVEKIFYDEQNNYSCLLVIIQKGVRHQIRCHLASIGCPIIWEKIYKKKKDTGQLHLRSIWVQSI
jgi:23S rRNA-/tRNA-specific pseudouridylate synthase